METAVLVAFAIQWIAIIALGLLVVGLIRQVGMLHERLGPVGALTLSGGPAIGELAPTFALPSLNGGETLVGGSSADGRSTLLFFLSPSCPICKGLLPVVKSLVQEFSGTVRLVLASDGDEADQLRMIVREKLADYPFVLSSELGRAHAVGKLPYAVLIGADGRVAAKGLVNNREHVESLFEAQRSGVASIQDYLQRRANEKRRDGFYDEN